MHERSRVNYGPDWPRIRAEVFKAAGITENEWPSWDLDHEPRYPLLGPDHRLYRLVPRRHQHHARKTARETASGIPSAWSSTGAPPGELFPSGIYNQSLPISWREWEAG